MKRSLSILLVFLFLISSSAYSKTISGEIVIKGDAPPGMKIKKKLKRSGLTVIKVPIGKEKEFVEKFKNKGYKANEILEAHIFGLKGEMIDISPDVSSMAAATDPYYSYQWHFPMIQANEAWDINAGDGVIVAIIDSGLSTGGADGINCVTNGWNTINESSNYYDGNGHGTHVAGTIAQNTNNGIGVAGLAHDSCIMPIKALGDDGYGDFTDITEAIYYAVQNGAQVINMSLGTDSYMGITNDPVMDAALDYAYANNVTVICAAGNDGNPYNVSYPAIYTTTIAIGSIGYGFYRIDYTNEGIGLDFLAPGGDTNDRNYDGFIDGVLQETVEYGTWMYYFYYGTSMASPHVAAMAAMLISNGNALTPDDIYNNMVDSSMDLVDVGWDTISGWGLIQVADGLMLNNCTDNDGDGYSTCDSDCDDSNPNVYPGAPEICYDNIDNNCNGAIDEGCACTDRDGDGYCVENGDCNDAPRLRGQYFHPGMDDINEPTWRNGADNDCNCIVDG